MNKKQAIKWVDHLGKKIWWVDDGDRVDFIAKQKSTYKSGTIRNITIYNGYSINTEYYVWVHIQADNKCDVASHWSLNAGDMIELIPESIYFTYAERKKHAQKLMREWKNGKRNKKL